MKDFMDKDFLLETETAKHLFHDYAENLPLVDYHCHIPPKDVYEDVRFDNLAEVWLGGENPDGSFFGDHYKWRLMRSNGINENEITGNADNKVRIRKFAEALELAIGNPMYHWSNFELHKFFAVEEALTPENSDRIYDLCAEKLRNDPNMSVRGLIRRSNVAFIGTTDDPIDSLEWHKKIAEDPTISVKVCPSFRPDKAINITKPGFADYIRKLETVTGKEIKSMLTSTIKTFASDLVDQIKDTDKIIAPNYFPGKENIEGCDELAAVVPEGMTLGCFRTSTITFPKNLTNLIKSLPTSSMKIFFTTLNFSDFIDAEMAAKIKSIAELLEAGISFAAPNGYCLAATIDIGGTIDAKVTDVPIISSLGIISTNPLDKKNGLVKKINTGDHATVVANAALVDNYCPAGSTLFSYTLNFDNPVNMPVSIVTISATLKGDIGFDMCLKSCNTDDDCRKDEGYACVELPDGVPAEGQTYDDMPKKKVCFDPANIDYFTKMTEDFKPAS